MSDDGLQSRAIWARDFDNKEPELRQTYDVGQQFGIDQETLEVQSSVLCFAVHTKYISFKSYMHPYLI